MEIRKLRTLTNEIFKVANEINPPYMKNIFTLKENVKVGQNDIIVKRVNTSRFGTQKLKVPRTKNVEQLVIKYKIRNIFSEI